MLIIEKVMKITNVFPRFFRESFGLRLNNLLVPTKNALIDNFRPMNSSQKGVFVEIQ